MARALTLPVDEHIRILVPELCVGETAATTLALIVHELATNSIKYGALSEARGTLEVACIKSGDEVVVLWTERNGPPRQASRAGRLRQQATRAERVRATRRFHRLRMAEGGCHRHAADEQGPDRAVALAKRKAQ